MDKHFSNTLVYLEKLSEQMEQNLKYGKELLDMIESIVKKLYDNNCKNDADNICNTYGRCGHHFLRSLWGEYNRSILT